MKNKYETIGGVTTIFLNSQKYSSMKTVISTSKLQRAKEFPGVWYPVYSKRTGTFYVVGASPMVRGKRKTIQLHRWVTKAPDGMQVDHRNHDTLDNTDGNLRVVTMAQNQQNRKGSNRNGTSGVRGVSWDKRAKKWVAKFNINGKRIYLGLFKSKTEARKAVSIERRKAMPYSEDHIEILEG